MVQLIFFIIFVLSMAVVSFIVVKKIPTLVQLPQNGSHGIKKPELFVHLERKIKSAHFNFFKKKMFLHKLLSKTRLIVLKIEAKIDAVLHGIRKETQRLEKEIKKTTRSRKTSL